MREAETLTCSLIVRAYNEEEHIGKLLAGIMEQTVQPKEIVLVDSGSTDATLAIASRFPTTVVSIEPEDFTFGRSLNLGCRQATGDILVIVSAHVYPVYPDWLERLVSVFEDPEVAVAYGRQRGDGNTRYSEHQIFAKLYPPGTELRSDNPFCNNANAAVRRELWEQHPYDEELPGLEDLEWAIWATSQGKKVAYVGEAEIVHLHDETFRQVYNRYRREAIGLKIIRPEENFRLVDFLRLVVSNVASDLGHALLDGRLWRVAGEILWFRTAQLWGTYRGFAHQGGVSRQLKQAFYYPRGFRGAGETSSGRTLQPIDYTQAMEQHGPLEGKD
jgi:rhamnosyltransferase